MQVHELVKSVKSKDDFIKFVGALHDDFLSNPTEWGNKDLSSYLAAMQAWTKDMDGYFKNQGLETPSSESWGLFAHILIAAKMYE